MNRIIKVMLCVLAPAVLLSCESFLDVVPDNRTELDNEEKISKMLVYAYPNRLYTYIADMSSDNHDFNGLNWNQRNYMQEEIWKWEEVTISDYDSPYNLWNGCYKAITNANQALEAIKELGSPATLDAQRGEALVCRAYAHFILATIFCVHPGFTTYNNMGLPYMDRLETIVSPKYDRGTLEELYENIEKDLLEGLPLIDDDSYQIPKYHFNRRAAYAFAARFYLYTAQWDKVIEYADEVLGDDPLRMLKNWKGLGSVEAGSIRYNQYISAGEPGNLMIMTASSAWQRVYRSGYIRYGHNIRIAQSETYNAPGVWGDKPNFAISGTTYVGSPAYVVLKLEEYSKVADPVAGTVYPYQVLPVFTGDELLLNRAEALIMKGGADNFEAAVKDMEVFLNNFSKSTYTLSTDLIDAVYGGMKEYTPLDPTPKKKLNPPFEIQSGLQENLIHCLLHFRRVLTITEGLRWFDVKRYGIEITRRSVSDETGVTIYSDEEDKEKKMNPVLSPDDPRRALQVPYEVYTAGLPKNPR